VLRDLRQLNSIPVPVVHVPNPKGLRYTVQYQVGNQTRMLAVPELSCAEVFRPLPHIYMNLPVLSGLAVHMIQDPLVAVPKQKIFYPESGIARGTGTSTERQEHPAEFGISIPYNRTIFLNNFWINFKRS
jgi:hypothetical protein